MVRTSARAEISKKNDQDIRLITPLLHRARYRRLYYLLIYHRLTIDLSRYYLERKQYNGLRTSQPSSTIDKLLNQRDHDFLHTFRLNKLEMRMLFDRFGDDPVFQYHGRKPQASAHYQISLLVYRLAHGQDVKTISRVFGIATGTVHLWNHRALISFIRQLPDIIRWPDQATRTAITQYFFHRYGIPHCVGFLDGININLNRAPSKGDEAGSYYSRKGRYGLNILAACNHRKLFTFIHWGYSARSSDMRLQRSMRPQVEPRSYFGPNEYLLADSGFKVTPTIIPMFKKRARKAEPSPRKMFFNNHVKGARVTIEHCFGILKGRWQFLRNASMSMRTSLDEARTHGMIQAAFILHNLTVKTWQQHMSEEELLEECRDNELVRKWCIEEEGRYQDVTEDGQRREILVDEILELQDDIDHELLLM